MTQELQYNKKSGFYFLDALPKNVDVGTYVFVFEVFLFVLLIFHLRQGISVSTYQL